MDFLKYFSYYCQKIMILPCYFGPPVLGDPVYRMSRKWRTSDALRCRRDYHKRENNVKKILLDLFADLAVFESGTYQVNYFEKKCIKLS
jgi:hypothetical protein